MALARHAQALAPRQIIAGEGGIALGCHLQPVLHQIMQGGQAVKRHVGVDVVFDMKGHVPRQKAHHTRGECGSGVFEHIGHLRAIAMFGQKWVTLYRSWLTTCALGVNTKKTWSTFVVFHKKFNFSVV
jgi:hypothetical protein